jgi:hypothetical protein
MKARRPAAVSRVAGLLFVLVVVRIANQKVRAQRAWNTSPAKRFSTAVSK